jgi:hypothetical protein
LSRRKELDGGWPQVGSNSYETRLASFPRGIDAEEKMKTLFQAQESSVPSQSNTRSSLKTRIAVLIGILVILGLALWEGVAAALRATSGHS